ncbi:MAG: hypothetical protein JW904_04885 [Spirochaetales bacterium]|nr:hypothetical protein [Spirochaetales bacterium]
MSEPVLVGLLFADRVITENNNKKGIIGTFNRFHAEKYPVAFPTWAIYAAATNLTGAHEFALNLIEEETSQVIIPISGKIEVASTSDVVELTPTIMGAVFPRPGSYTLSFHIDGSVIGARTLYVQKAEPK